MGIEIEWKFVVLRLPALPAGRRERIEQGYFSAPGGPAVRVRLRGAGATLDVKAEVPGTRAAGSPQVCREFTYEIPRGDGEELIRLAPWRVAKTRYHAPGGIELDVFDGPEPRLVVAEVEVPEGAPRPAAPDGWEWRDVSSDPRYVNRALAEHGPPADAPRCRIG